MDTKLDLPPRTVLMSPQSTRSMRSFTRSALCLALFLGVPACAYNPPDLFGTRLEANDAHNNTDNEVRNDVLIDASEEPGNETGVTDIGIEDTIQATDGGDVPMDSTVPMDVITDVGIDVATEDSSVTIDTSDTGTATDMAAPETTPLDTTSSVDSGLDTTTSDTTSTDTSTTGSDSGEDSSRLDTGLTDSSTSPDSDTRIDASGDTLNDTDDTARRDAGVDSADSSAFDVPTDTSGPADRPGDVGVVPTGPVILRPVGTALASCDMVVVDIPGCSPGATTCDYHTATGGRLRYFIRTVTIPTGAPEPGVYAFQHMLTEPSIRGFAVPDTGFFITVYLSGSYNVRASVIAGPYVTVCHGPTIRIVTP